MMDKQLTTPSVKYMLHLYHHVPYQLAFLTALSTNPLNSNARLN